jgi:hypothetical protein
MKPWAGLVAHVLVLSGLAGIAAAAEPPAPRPLLPWSQEPPAPAAMAEPSSPLEWWQPDPSPWTPRGQFIGGMGIYYLKPSWHGSGEAGDLGFRPQIAPQAWFGYQGGQGLGARARYWNLDASGEGDPLR